MARTLQLGDSGPDVKKLQQVLNARGTGRHYPTLAVDGRLGPRTMWAYQDLGWALGFLPETLNHGVTATAQELLADPAKRSQGQLDRARERAPRMALRTIAFDGTPVFWGLAKALKRARQHGWQGQLNSADRREGVAERYGKQSQAKLYACFTNSEATGSCSCSSCNPANPPGRSSHELRADGSDAFPGPVGRVLRWWELGLDCSQSVQLVAKLGSLGYAVHRPYSSPSEAHHVNFKADPGPVVDLPDSVDDAVPIGIPPFDPIADPLPTDALEPAGDVAVVEERVPAGVSAGASNGSAGDDASFAGPSAAPTLASARASAAPPIHAEEDRLADASSGASLEDDVPAPADDLTMLAGDTALLDDVAPAGDGVIHLVAGPAAVQGLDVSYYQGDIDWRKVRNAGHRFTFVRATYGADDVDPKFGPGRLRAMKEAGIVRGYYHYAYPSGGDAVTEARHAVRTIEAAGGLVKGDLPLALDLEETQLGPAATYKWASDFCEEVKRLTGRGCIVYTGPYFWRDKVGDPPRPPIQGAVLWIAHYEVSRPAVPRAWRHRGWSFWQFTSSGSCPGIQGRVDQNHWQGSQAEFDALRLR